MIGKLLLAALIIGGVLLYARAGRPAPQRRAPPASPWARRAVPAALLLGALLAASLVFWLEWREEHRLFTVRVIDTRSGEVSRYVVYRDDVRGRRFTTVDGREITLADVERMEIVEGVDEGVSD